MSAVRINEEWCATTFEQNTGYGVNGVCKIHPSLDLYSSDFFYSDINQSLNKPPQVGLVLYLEILDFTRLSFTICGGVYPKMFNLRVSVC